MYSFAVKSCFISDICAKKLLFLRNIALFCRIQFEIIESGKFYNCDISIYFVLEGTHKVSYLMGAVYDVQCIELRGEVK